MGLNHARDDYGAAGAYSYSFGYKWPGYRTVMAYAPGTRILYFSNPNVLYLGNATGVARRARNSAYNALSLNNTRVDRGQLATGPNARHPRDRAERRRDWNAGSARTVTWTTTSLPAGALVQLGSTSASGTVFLATVPASQGSYSWSVSPTPGPSWRIKACVKPAASSPSRRTRGAASPACLASDASDAPFSITP